MPATTQLRGLSDACKFQLSNQSTIITSFASAAASSQQDLAQHGSKLSRRYIPATASIYADDEKHTIQKIAFSTSLFTVLAVLVTFWSFYHMQHKRLRHQLIMLSIFGCFVRGLWYLIFAIVTMTGKDVASSSSLCQSAGFFIHVGNEINDISTLFIAVHGALQILRPSVSTHGPDDGLYEYRWYCYASILIVPLIVGSISFVNPDPAYTAQGAFCSLPTSPIWYRLALSYAPRYLIALIIICLSIAVYIHVEFKLRSFAKSARALRTSIASTTTQRTLGSHKARSSIYGLSTIRRSYSAARRATIIGPALAPELTAQQRQEAERRALRRQLWLIFVYPILYVVLWIPPCTLIMMHYSPRYMDDLPYWLGVLATICLTLMGGIDCIVFYWREKPWRRSYRHHERNDVLPLQDEPRNSGDDPEKGQETPPEEMPFRPRAPTLVTSGIAKGVAALSPTRSPEGRMKRLSSSVATQRAYERLALEIKDRKDKAKQSVDYTDSPEGSFPNLRSSVASSSKMGSGFRKEWWDRQGSFSNTPASASRTNSTAKREWWDRQGSFSTVHGNSSRTNSTSHKGWWDRQNSVSIELT